MFLERLNEFDSNLKFTHDKSQTRINFLDVNIRIEGQVLVSDLYFKETDRHQFLHFDSCHPRHVKTSIVYSQAIRIKRICSLTTDLNIRLQDLEKWFIERGYPRNMVQSQIDRALKSDNNQVGGSKSGAVPLVITFHPKLSDVGKILWENLDVLYKDEEAKKVFSPPPFVSFKAPRNLKSHLVRSKLYPMERKTGSAKCNKNSCKVCKNVSETKTFESKNNNKTYIINHHLNCDDKKLVYLLTCKSCGLQYVGQTSDKFRYRWNNYKDNNRKAEQGIAHMQSHIFEHFSMEGHNGFLEDCIITFIDKTDASDPTRREKYWINILNTLVPNGLNISESN